MVQFTRYIIALSIPAFSHGCAVHGSPPCNDYLSSVIETYDVLLADLERTILKLANQHDPVSYALLQSVYGIGRIGALTILYEIENIKRFPRVQDFVSYARLVK